MRKIKRITGIEGVARLGTARVKLPVNHRAFALTFFATIAGVAAAADSVIGKVTVYVNGLPIWNVLASHLLARAARDGRTLATGELPLDFADPARADKVDEQITAFDLFGETSFEVELELLDPAVPGDLGITGIREFDGGWAEKDGKHIKQVVKLFTVGKNANLGENDVDNIPVRDAIQRLTFFGAALPTAFEVDADGVQVCKATVVELDSVYKKHGHVAIAGSTPLRFDYTERIDDFLIVRKDLNVRITMGAAAALTIMVEAVAAGFN